MRHYRNKTHLKPPPAVRHLPSQIAHKSKMSATAPTPAAARPPPADDVSRQTLAAEAELRIEVPVGVTSTITLVRGAAEIFGAELAPSTPIRVTGAKVAVFTWHGCEVRTSASKGRGICASDDAL